MTGEARGEFCTQETIIIVTFDLEGTQVSFMDQCFFFLPHTLQQIQLSEHKTNK